MISDMALLLPSKVVLGAWMTPGAPCILIIRDVIVVMVEPFENLEGEFAFWLGFPPEQVAVCSSGSSALHLAIETLQLPQGSEVICPDLTMIACARAISLSDMTPVFVDCNETLLIDPHLVREAITARTRAIMVVHIYGRMADLDAIHAIAAEHGLAVIEDCAECPRPYARGEHHSHASTYSFYRNKPIFGEEGGAVAFRNPAHAALARQLRTLGFTEAHDYRHVPRGHNYRMSNAHATLILQSLRNVEHNQRARRQIEAWYNAACPDEWRMPKRDAVWVYDLMLPFRGDFVGGYGTVDVVVRALKAAGIEARHGFKPMHEQEEYKGCRLVSSEDEFVKHYPMSCQMARRVIYLPVQPGITTEDSVRTAFDVIRRTLA